MKLRVRGFSLLELLVVVAIIGALAAAGVVGYQNYSRDAKIETGAYNMNTVFRYMLNVRQQLPLAGSLGDQCEIKVGSPIACADVNTLPNDFLEAFRTKVREEFGFENPIFPDCPIALMYYTTATAASSVEGTGGQLDEMGLSPTKPAGCVIQPSTVTEPEYVEGAIYFKLLPNTLGPDLEYFEAQMFMPCDSLETPGSLCQ